MSYDRFTTGWYSIFLDTIPKEHSAAEVGLIERHLPRHAYPTLLDIACGSGRHSEILGERGYTLVGIDKNAAAIAAAEKKAIPGASFLEMDMRNVAQLGTSFDGAVNLWHSFGYYDAATNAQILTDVGKVLRPKGRAIFDIYNRDHLNTLPAVERSERGGKPIETFRSWQGDRMRCQINYQDAPSDLFEWQIYTPTEFGQLTQASGFTEVTRCAWFDESIAPSAEHARMQFVLEKNQ